MTFDPRWLNQLPLSSLKGEDINDVYSLTGSLGLDVGEWEASGAQTIVAEGVAALDTTPLKSGNIFVAYEIAGGYRAEVRTSLGISLGITPAVFGTGGDSGDLIRVATLSNGNVVVVYLDKTSSKVAFIIYDERLNVVTPATLIPGTTGFTQGKVSTLADGNFVVAYTNSTSKAAFQIFDIDGDVVKGETIITTSLHGRVEVIGLKNGNFIVGLSQGTTLYFTIYDRQGVHILAPTTFTTNRTFIRKPLALLPNGQVAIGFKTTATGRIGYGLVDQEGNIVSAAADKSTATLLTEGGLCALSNNSVAMIYGSDTAIYFKVSNLTETALTGPFVAVASLLPGVSNDGNFYCLFIDTDVKFRGVRGKTALFGKELGITGALTANGAAVFNNNFKIGGAGQVVTLTSNATLTASATTLPTSNAVKSYIDQQTGNIPRNIIHQDNSKVEVVDSTGATQYITFNLNNNELARIEDFGATKTLRLGPAADTRIAINTDAGTLEFMSGVNEVLHLERGNQVIGVDTSMTVDQTSNSIIFEANNVPQVRVDSSGLSVASGVKINYFSDAVDLGAASPLATTLPTQYAVKTYVDTVINGLNPNKIWQDNSKVEVIDDGTASGSIQIVADNVQVAHFDVLSSTQRIGKAAESRLLVSDDTVSVYAGASPAEVLNLDGTSQRLGTATDSRIVVSQAADSVTIYAANTLHGTFGATGLTLSTGSAVLGFTNDDTLAEDSSTMVPTEYAVKTYIDTAIANLNPDKIWAGNSKVEVIDDSTNSGSVQIVADGVEVASFQATAQRIGLADNSKLDLANGTTNLFAGTGQFITATATAQTLGIAGDTRLALSQAADTVNLYVANTAIITGALTSQTFGIASDSRLELSQASDTADLYAGTTQIVDGAMETQTFGVASDSRLFLDQANNYADLYAGTTQIIDGAPLAQVFGVSGDSRLELDQQNNTVDLYAGTIHVVAATTNVLTLGVSGDTYCTINQQDNLINTYTGNALQMQVEDSGVSIEGNLTVRGDLLIDGTAFVVFNEEVSTQDNIITVNYAQPGVGVTRGIAGLEVARGSLPIYQFIFDEDSDTFRVGEVDQTQAVATREDDPDGYKVAWWNDASRRFETVGTEYISVDQTSNNIVFVTGNSVRGTFDSNGLTLTTGASVNEFSTDPTLAGNSNDAVPTEAAIRSFVTAQIGGQANIIFEDDSSVKVTDDGTASGYITVSADNVDVASFYDATQRIGKAAESRLLVSNDTVIIYAGASPADVFNMGATQRVGLASNSRLSLATGTADVFAGTAQFITGAATAQTFGIAGDSRVVVDQSADTVDLYAGATRVLAGAVGTQTFGVTGDTIISLDQGTNLIDFTAGGSSVGDLTLMTQRIGLAANSKLSLANGTADLFAGTAQFITGAATAQTFGIAGDTRLDISQAADTANLYVANTAIITGALTSQTFGIAGDSRLFLDQGNDLADLYAGTTQIVDGAVTSQTFGVAGDSRLALDQTGDTAKLYAGGTLVLDTGLLSQVLGISGDTRITLNQTTDIVGFYSGASLRGQFDSTGLTLSLGVGILEFSIDGTLVGNSDTAVPTEKAIKTYVDKEINDLRQELDLINIRNISGGDTTASTGDVILADTTAGDITIQLMESTDGKIIIKKKSTDGNKVYITTTPGLIDGQSQIIIDTGYQSYTFVCDGTNFFII